MPSELLDMTELETLSWIFLATALASQAEPTKHAGISDIADGINHAVPTHHEMQNSLKWLTKKKLVAKKSSKYRLTIQGETLFNTIQSKSNNLLDIWKDIEITFQKLI